MQHIFIKQFNERKIAKHFKKNGEQIIYSSNRFDMNQKSSPTKA